MAEENLGNRREIAIREFKKLTDEFQIKNGIVLDVGCCNDYNKKAIDEIGLFWLGMDIIQNKNVWLKGKIEDIPLHDGIVTCIFASHIFEHTINPIQTLKEFSRVLRLNGILFIVAPVPDFRLIHLMDKTHYFVLSPDQITSLLLKSGFSINRSYIVKDNEGYDNVIIVAFNVGGIR